MSYSYSYSVDAAGKYTTFFDGVVHSGCVQDADCPAYAYCYVGADWAAFPSMCACEASYGWEGAGCGQVTVWGLVPAVVAIFPGMLVSFISFTVLMYYAFHLLQLEGLRLNALHSTVALCLGASLSIMCENALFTQQALSPHDTLLAADNSRQTFNVHAINAFIALSFFLTTASSLNVSLVWLAIAEDTRTMSNRHEAIVYRYRYGLLIYYVVFFVGIIIALVVYDSTLGTLALAIPGLVFLIFSYLFGWLRLRRVIQSMESSSNMEASAIGNKAHLSLKSAFGEIANTAVTLSGLLILLIVMYAAWIGMGGTGFDKPGHGGGYILLQASWVVASIGTLIVSMYLALAIRRKLLKRAALVQAHGDGAARHDAHLSSKPGSSTLVSASLPLSPHV